MKLLSLLCALVFMLAPVEAFSHTQWSNGDPIPSWVKSQCCGPSDAHHLTQDQVHVVAEGYKVDGYNKVLPYDKKLPSPDGDWWIFYRTDPDGSQSPVYCFFGPDPGV